MNARQKLITLAIVVLLLAGCSGRLEWWTDGQRPTDAPEATETVFYTPTYTSTPTPAKTPTAAPTDAPSATPTITPTPNPLTNILINPSFEGDYVTQNGIPEIRVAPGWVAWWIEEDTGVSWEMNRPEFGDSQYYAYRIHDGAKSQVIHKLYSTWFAGVAQRVSINPGDQIMVRVWVQSWSSAYDDNDIDPLTPPLSTDADPGQKVIMIGVDPEGGLDPLAPSVEWGAVYTLFEYGSNGAYNHSLGCGYDLDGKSPVYDYDSDGDFVADTPAYNCLQMTAYATGNTITVFVGGGPNYPVKHNDLYLDDAWAAVIGHDATMPTAAPSLTAQPSPTPESASVEIRAIVNNLRIRSGPSTSAEILGQLNTGDVCLCASACDSIGTPGLWVSVTCGNVVGWVSTGGQGGLYLYFN